jgi:hypothetical protein
VFVLDLDIVVLTEISSERGKSQWWKHEYLIGLRKGLVASVNAGRIISIFIGSFPRR